MYCINVVALHFIKENIIDFLLTYVSISNMSFLTPCFSKWLLKRRFTEENVRLSPVFPRERMFNCVGAFSFPFPLTLTPLLPLLVLGVDVANGDLWTGDESGCGRSGAGCGGWGGVITVWGKGMKNDKLIRSHGNKCLHDRRYKKAREIHWKWKFSLE